VGYNQNSTIAECYAAGFVAGDYQVGGLVGYDERSGENVISSFWDIEISGLNTSSGGAGRMTAEMQDINTFLAAGWSFSGASHEISGVWTMDSRSGYPILGWQVFDMTRPSFSGGTGIGEDPYLISCAEQLEHISRHPGLKESSFRLVSDIDLAGTDLSPIGSETMPFAGAFDGDGHIIANWRYDANEGDCIGLFGYVDGPRAVIQNLGLIDPNIVIGSGEFVGSLVGCLASGTLTNCFVTGGSVAGEYSIGGLVGYNNDGIIWACCAKAGGVSGHMYIGGLVGQNGSGACGDTVQGTVKDCYTTNTVTGVWRIGGLVGYNRNLIMNCYAIGPVISESTGGGLVGYEWHNVTQTTASFWDVQTSGKEWSDGGTGLTTAEMQTASTFLEAGWDFIGETENGIEDIWWILEGQDYPRLWWERDASL
jgi:hypothetical protein